MNLEKPSSLGQVVNLVNHRVGGGHLESQEQIHSIPRRRPLGHHCASYLAGLVSRVIATARLNVSLSLLNRLSDAVVMLCESLRVEHPVVDSQSFTEPDPVHFRSYDFL